VLFLLLPGLPRKKGCLQTSQRFRDNLCGFLHAFWPIVIVAGLYACLDITPALGMLAAIILFLLFHKVPFIQWRQIFKSGFEFDILLLILGALLFKLHIQAGHAVEAVVEFLIHMNVHPLILVFFLPFLVVFVTGMSMATVAITFPFLIPFIGTGPDARMGLEVLAFSGIICGLALSPIHLCIPLSAGYFETSLRRVVGNLVGAVLIIAAAGLLMALFAPTG
jgi:uncharacterized protein